MVQEAIRNLCPLLMNWCDPKVKSTMYRKDLLKECLSAHLASYEWYLDYTSTPKVERGLKEKFENGHFDKPTSTNYSFKGGRKS